MSDSPPDLAQLRRRIDEIDDRLHALLIERVDIISSVSAQKRSNTGIAPHQPGREAEILRRLIARNHGALAPATLVRIWRELLAATNRLQGSFTIAVYAPPETPGLWDVARDHYGSHTPMLAFRSTAQVIRAVTEEQAAIGVLPMPQEEEPDPWWRHLLSTDETAPHVIARLPFGARGNARSDNLDALAIGRGTAQSTGHDRTLIATENAPDISRGRIFSTLQALDLPCTFMASSEQGDGVNTLIEMDGCVAMSDPRLDRFRSHFGAALYRFLWFGGYAVPLSAAELAPPRVRGYGADARA
ncbi:MAG TPA: chorismate mutase [Stellaceae bacterium]|jgi:chorismate mutase|nr:chorismate mutase [Stellaceae bacterium]